MNRYSNQNLAVVLHYFVKALPPIGAIFSIWVGYRLFVMGVGGTASLVIGANDFKGQLTNAAPGLVCICVGLVILGISAWRGISIYSDVTKSRTRFAANESQEEVVHSSEYPDERGHPDEKAKNTKANPEVIQAIGPHVSFDYKKGRPE